MTTGGFLSGGVAVTSVTSTGSTTSRLIVDRFAEKHNVRDFGAVGDGFTDDLDWITAAINWQVITKTRGTIYFPAGIYYVRAPIDFSPLPGGGDTGIFVNFQGEIGLSVVVGDFADYVFKREFVGPQRWGPPGCFVEQLTIINRHAGGGGIRMGATQGAAIRDCDITADIAINDDNTDVLIDNGNINGAFELDIQNCNCRPYNTLATGSIGIYKCSDGPVTNCTVIGFDVGMCTASGQGGGAIQGCYFQGNNYGFFSGHGVEAWSGAGSNYLLEGCHFKGNGIAINTGSGAGVCRGNFIEAATGSISGNPQYGVRVTAGHSITMAGVFVGGDFQQYGFSFAGGESTRALQSIIAVGSLNSVSSPTKNWQLTEAKTSKLQAINKATVFTVLQLPAWSFPVTSISWRAGRVKTVTTIVAGSGYVPGSYENVPLTGGSGSGATAKITVSGAGTVSAVSIETSDMNVGSGYVVGNSLSASNTHLGGSGSGFSVSVASVENAVTVNFTPTAPVDPSNLAGKIALLTISGVTPSGYNGTFEGTVISGLQITYPLTSNPGGSGSGASMAIFFTGSDRRFTDNAYEGETYNVSDANVATWGNPVTAGSGSNHVKVRYTPAAWTVVGK